MEQQTDETTMLDLMLRPAFCVKQHIITRINQAAAKLFLREGLPLEPLLESGAEDYASFREGMLYLTLIIHGQRFGACVVRIGEEDIFTLDQQFENEQLRVLALAARELRGPLSNAMLAAQRLSETEDRAVQGSVSRLNRGLYQLLRIVGNMSDASGDCPPFRPENVNLSALFREIGQKACALTQDSGVTVSYTGTDEEIICSADSQLLERAALNMISNALKFTPAGGTVRLSLQRIGQLLRFSVQDSGSGIPAEEQATLFCRYLREPGIEDIRHGIGLGMLLIRNAAARHGGTVLVDHPEQTGTRITMTISTAAHATGVLHSSALKTDYAGEQDHALIELSELLPPELY